MLAHNHKIAYVYEIGDMDLDLTKPGAAPYFVLCAVIVEPGETKRLLQGIGKIRELELDGAELIANAVNRGQRFRILKGLLDLPFRVISLVVDKGEIYPDLAPAGGHNFGAYVAEMWETALKQSFSNLKMVVDQDLADSFINSFQNYMQKKKGLLFNPYPMGPKRIEECSLLQLARFLTETIAAGYGPTAARHYRAYLNFLQDKIITKKILPRSYSEYLREETTKLENFAADIAAWCIKAALNYLNEHEGSVLLEELNRVIVVDRLLFQLQVNAGEYLGTNKLKELIRTTSGLNYTNQQFRANIIAPLRDAGVIIASSVHGYKIPVTAEEVYSYSSQILNMVYPMLTRLQQCRESILRATGGKMDIMADPEYKRIKELFSALEKADKQSQ
ncbi:MAG TPA: hypothetical protein GX528_02175 [Firmicutes bacterium]|nr:hypothetical protein [Bacillota bacterium]